MSHFCGMVITTPNCGKDFDSQLDSYYEGLELPMHLVMTKEQIIEKGREDIEDYKNGRYAEYLKDPEAYKASCHFPEHIKYISEEFPKKLQWTDEEVYEDYIDGYRKDIENGATYCEIHEDGSLWKTTNENAKWDWWEIGGRWDGSIKTKDGSYVNTCQLGEIDWTPFKDEDYEKEEKEDYFGRKYRPLKEGINWHFTKEDTPFCVVIDGLWNEKGEMGWWGVTSNEKDDWDTIFFELIDELPADSEVTLVDFHI